MERWEYGDPFEVAHAAPAPGVSLGPAQGDLAVEFAELADQALRHREFSSRAQRDAFCYMLGLLRGLYADRPTLGLAAVRDFLDAAPGEAA